MFFLIVAILCISITFLLDFPSLRVYMIIGYAIGGIIYLKTLRRIVAFFEKVCYNKIIKLIRKAKNKKKLSEKEVD